MSSASEQKAGTKNKDPFLKMSSVTYYALGN